MPKTAKEGEGGGFTYDKEGRVLTVIAPDSTLQETNVYDEAGQLLQTLDGQGNGVNYTYDLGGRRTRIATTGQASQSYTYDALGHVSSAPMKVITGIQNAVADCQTHKAVHDKYIKIGWKVLTLEQATVEKKPEPKHSLKERLLYEQAESKKKQEQKAPQHKKQNMEL